MLKKLFQRMGQESFSPGPAELPRVQPRPPVAPSTSGVKARVLFVCYGNSCRSPMAEGLARHYGSDVMWVQSAGLAPINRIDPLGIKVMKDRNIDITDAFPKGPDAVNPQSFDLIVNMSGQKLPSITVPVEEWSVPDPIGQGEEEFRKAADMLEQLVMRLILQLRLKKR